MSYVVAVAVLPSLFRTWLVVLRELCRTPGLKARRNLCWLCFCVCVCVCEAWSRLGGLMVAHSAAVAGSASQSSGHLTGRFLCRVNGIWQTDNSFSG